MGVNFRQNVNWRYVNVLKTPFLIKGFNLKFRKFYFQSKYNYQNIIVNYFIFLYGII